MKLSPSAMWRKKNSLGSGATSMNVPPMGFPSPTSWANALMLKLVTDVLAVTNFWLLKSLGCSKSRKTYLCAATDSQYRTNAGRSSTPLAGAQESQRAAWAGSTARVARSG